MATVDERKSIKWKQVRHTHTQTETNNENIIHIQHGK